ncbi:MAG: hypothetical protein J6M05_03795 [Cardiobacteriaceae bacterium]|nr:hypothetical protein [Cardiobacteriaceae bacterium]
MSREFAVEIFRCAQNDGRGEIFRLRLKMTVAAEIFRLRLKMTVICGEIFRLRLKMTEETGIGKNKKSAV